MKKKGFIIETYQEFSKRYLNEALSQDCYHITKIGNIYDILRDNKIKLSKSVTDNEDNYHNYLYFLSLTRQKRMDRGYGVNISEAVIITFDYKKLNNNFKSRPIDFFNKTSRHTRENEKDYSKLESEERILRNRPYINDISNYIKEISVITTKPDVINEISYYCKSYGIDLSFYSNVANYNSNIKYMEIENETPTKYGNVTEEEHIVSEFLSYLLPIVAIGEVILKDKKLYEAVVTRIAFQYSLNKLEYADLLKIQEVDSFIKPIISKLNNMGINGNNNDLDYGIDKFLETIIEHGYIHFDYVDYDVFKNDTVQEYVTSINNKLNRLSLKIYNEKIGDLNPKEIKDMLLNPEK
jgi:hypothetical protein